MLLRDYLDRYNRAREIKPSTLEHYRWVIRSFERHNGQLRTSQLSGQAVDDWLIWLRDNGRSPWTIKQRKISLLVLWRAAWSDGFAPPLEPVRRLRPLQHAPEAWTLDEVRALIAAAESYHSRPLWTGSLIRVGYDTGLRLGDLLAVQVGQITSNLLRVVQGKTGRPVVCQIRPETRQAVDAYIEAYRPETVLWPLWGRREALYRHIRAIVRQASIRPGTFRWLRRSAATQLEIVSPGRGTELLGHASRATSEAWYLDRSQFGAAPLPPL